MVDLFINRKHGKEEATYLHPSLEPIPERDAWSNSISGAGHAYRQPSGRIYPEPRRQTSGAAMGKKKPEIMAKFKDQFMSGSANGIPKETAHSIFELMEFFCRIRVQQVSFRSLCSNHIPNRLFEGKLYRPVHGCSVELGEKRIPIKSWNILKIAVAFLVLK